MDGLMMWMIRTNIDDDDFDYSVAYGGEPRLFSIKIHHGGKFVVEPKREYVGGSVSFVDCCDIDLFDIDVLEEMVKNIGYPPDMVFYFHFKIHGKSIDDGLRHIANPHVIRLLVTTVRSGVKLVEIYVEHWHSRILTGFLGDDKCAADDDLDHVDEGDENGDGEGVEQGESDYDDDCSTDQELPSSVHADLQLDEDNNLVDDFVVEDVDVDVELFDQRMASKNVTDDHLDDPYYDDGIDPIDMQHFSSNSEDEVHTTALKTCMRRIRKEQRRKSNTVTEDCPFFIGQMIDDKQVLKTLVKQLALKTRRQLYISKNDKIRVRVVCIGESIDGSLNEGQNSNICDKKKETNVAAGKANKDKGKKQKVPRKKPPTPTCPWVLHCSRNSDLDPWVVKTLKDHHTCLQTRDLKQYTMSFIAREITPIIQSNPQIPLHSLQEQLQKVNQINVGIQKLFRAKMIASKKIIGDYKEQYGFLREYCEEILRTNPGSTVKLNVEPAANPSSDSRQFRRIYICYAALKRGFKLCGRNLIGIDGAFMKGPYPGQILSAVGVDSNNGIYPVAFALVEAETFKSWEWFLELLGDDLDWDASSHVTFISDRQKGLLPALAKVFPSAEHRFCLRHVHDNMKKQWGGVLFKNLLWKAASATNEAKFIRAMEEIKQTNVKLFQWLSEIPASSWTRAHFTGRAQSDILLNNLCEVFNKQLVGARDKPIYTCLEYIRTYMQKRIVNVNKVISKSVGPLTPAATKIFNKIKDEASQYVALLHGPNKYQVNGPWSDQVVVDMEAKTCTCRRWELTGMPCRHVVCVIWDMANNKLGSGVAESYVSKVYWLNTWKDTYSMNISPMSGREHWLPSRCPTSLIPPKHHTPIGRPKKARRKGFDENSKSVEVNGRLTRKGATVTCSKCGKQGHNQRGCKGQPAESSSKRQGSHGKNISKKRARKGADVIEMSQGAPNMSQDQV